MLAKFGKKCVALKKIKMSAPLIQIESTHDDNNRHQRQYEQPPRRKRVHLCPLVCWLSHRCSWTRRVGEGDGRSQDRPRTPRWGPTRRRRGASWKGFCRLQSGNLFSMHNCYSLWSVPSSFVMQMALMTFQEKIIPVLEQRRILFPTRLK